MNSWNLSRHERIYFLQIIGFVKFLCIHPTKTDSAHQRYLSLIFQWGIGVTDHEFCGVGILCARRVDRLSLKLLWQSYIVDFLS